MSHVSRPAGLAAAGNYQFRLRTLFAVVLLVGGLCGLAQWSATYVVAGISLVCGALLVNGFVTSPDQRHVRVMGTLVGGLLYLLSLWLPVSRGFDVIGWQAAGLYAAQTWDLDYRDILLVHYWDVAKIWMINMGNLMAFALPAWVVAKPKQLSTTLTVLAVLAATQAWLYPLIHAGPEITWEQTGYWLWCIALTVLAGARLVPFRYCFQQSTPWVASRPPHDSNCKVV